MCSPSDRGPHAQQAGVALALTVALCLALALSLIGCAASGSAASAPTPTRTSATSGVVSGVAGWSSYRDPADGFVVEYPRGATAFDATATASASLTSWRIANPQGGADATLEVTATAQASAGVCAHYTDGKPVTLAGGVIGYEQDNLSDPTPTSTVSQPQIAVIVLHSGLLTIITLTGQGQPNTFLQRWGSVWGHILATFQPGQGPTGAQPCG